MEKLSNTQRGQMMKLAADNLRVLSSENQQLRDENEGLKAKLAGHEKRARVEKIAHAMEEKGLEPELSIAEKVEGLLKREDLDVVETAVGLTAPQMKLASVHDDDSDVDVTVEGDGNRAAQQFNAALASI
jgi:cell division septum initiation protein DivIVA